MASPPFNINQSLPGDTDIVSQHPVNARQMRDIVESWLLVNHDTNGNHARVDMPRIASPTTPAASIDVLYVTTTGRLKIKHPDATEEYVGLPPAITGFTAGSVPVGYLAADGSAVSRSTFADLFTEIGTTYGAGDGSTTFNVPDIKGRVIAGIDGGANRLTASFFGTAAILAAVGGAETTILTVAQLASHNHPVFLFDPGHSHSSGSFFTQSGPGVGGGGAFGTNLSTSTSTNTTGITVRDTAGGGGTANQTNTAGSGGAHSNVQSTIILRPIIKY